MAMKCHVRRQNAQIKPEAKPCQVEKFPVLLSFRRQKSINHVNWNFMNVILLLIVKLRLLIEIYEDGVRLKVI